MTQDDKTRIDELISAYIDDELSEREQTELKRLVDNDRQVAEQLRSLQRQKEILGALPPVGAPQGMAHDIKSALEPRFIVGDIAQAPAEPDGRKELRKRNLLTTAALIFVPIGILAAVIFRIVMPLSPDSGKSVASNRKGAAPSEHLAVSFPLDASLYLTSSDKTAVTNFINKTIYEKSLVNNTTSSVYSNIRTTYTIKADRRLITALLRDLATTWDRIEHAALTVHGPNLAANVRIEDITPDQAVGLYQSDIFSDPVRLAKSYDMVNRLAETLPGNGYLATFPWQGHSGETLSVPTAPTLTSPVEPKQPAESVEAVCSATLTITVINPNAR
jgi:anti-sigma factor RsiW